MGRHYNALRNARNRHDDNTLIIPFRLLTNDPLAVANAVADRLRLDSFDGWDPDNVEQVTVENDDVHGMDLHKIKRKIEPVEGSPWAGILDAPLEKLILDRFPDVAKWANGDT